MKKVTTPFDYGRALARVERFVKVRLGKEGTGHDWWHIERVRNNARAINKHEAADPVVVELAVLLHDVGDRKVIGASEDDYSIAEQCMVKERVPVAVRAEVMDIIKHMSYSTSLTDHDYVPTKAFAVVQDADRLDAIGAIGVARAFAYGGSQGRLLYDPTKSAVVHKNARSYKQGTSSSFHHFEEKLLRLASLMRTKTGKRIAKRRHAYMQKFMDQFLAEWKGER